MKLPRWVLPVVIVAFSGLGLTAAGYFTRQWWLPKVQRARPNEPTPGAVTGETVAPATKVIVGDQAQQNLGLTAKSLKADTYWKTITVPGVVVDRPGLSDRGVVSPVTAIVSDIHHVPGDTVRPGDVLFTLKLLSESLHLTQTDLFKTAQDIVLAQAQRKRLAESGQGIAEARLIEVDSQITRLQVAAKAYRQELLNRGLADKDIDGVAQGTFVSEISVLAPDRMRCHKPLAVAFNTKFAPVAVAPAFELQELKVELGQQVQAGQTLCLLANHQSLAIEGRAFRDEAPLLERSLKEGWSVEVDFQEDSTGDWGEVVQTFPIEYIANYIDPVNRTFAFLLPLENQSTAVKRDEKTQLLWRYRPGQRVRLRVRVEKIENVFVVPADAVVREGAEAFVFSQNVNTFERKGVRVLLRDRTRVVLANDGALPTYVKDKEVWTLPAIAQTAAAQLNRMVKAGSAGVPKGYHIHADGSLHKNEDEGK